MRRRFFFLVSVALFLPSVAWAQLLGPSPYLGFGDSPFNGVPFEYFWLEDFEFGRLDAPGVTRSAGTVIGPGGPTDSVDEDDGFIDGSGSDGHSMYRSTGPSGIVFTFDATVLGRLPTHAGLVWTDGRNNIRFEAFDQNGVSLGVLNGSHADTSMLGYTAEDRFYGAIHGAGIKSISIACGLPANGGELEIDHLQFGAASVPVSVSDTGSELWLLGGSPNPFQKRATIWFSLPKSGLARLTVHDISGRLVKELVSQSLEPGMHTASWDGSDGVGGRSRAGVYLLRLESDGLARTARLVLID